MRALSFVKEQFSFYALGKTKFFMYFCDKDCKPIEYEHK